MLPLLLQETQSILSNRLNPDGTKDVTITVKDATHLYIEVPGMTEAESVKAKGVIEKAGRLQFRLLGPDGLTFTTAEDATIKPGYVKLRYLDKEGDQTNKTEGEKKIATSPRFLWVKNKAELSGNTVKNAVTYVAPVSVDHSIRVTLEEEAGEKMRAISKASIGKQLAICVENAPGEFEIVSAPTVNGAFGADFEITGRFTFEEASALASQLMNPLEIPLVVEKTTVITPSSAPRTSK